MKRLLVALLGLLLMAFPTIAADPLPILKDIVFEIGYNGNGVTEFRLYERLEGFDLDFHLAATIGSTERTIQHTLAEDTCYEWYTVAYSSTYNIESKPSNTVSVCKEGDTITYPTLTSPLIIRTTTVDSP